MGSLDSAIRLPFILDFYSIRLFDCRALTLILNDPANNTAVISRNEEEKGTNRDAATYR